MGRIKLTKQKNMKSSIILVNQSSEAGFTIEQIQNFYTDQFMILVSIMGILVVFVGFVIPLINYKRDEKKQQALEERILQFETSKSKMENELEKLQSKIEQDTKDFNAKKLEYSNEFDRLKRNIGVIEAKSNGSIYHLQAKIAYDSSQYENAIINVIAAIKYNLIGNQDILSSEIKLLGEVS